MKKHTETPKPLIFNAAKDGMALIVCPSCGFSKEKNAFKTDIAHKKTKEVCKCGHAFEFIVGFRTFYRKKVNLAGQCEHIKSLKREVIQIKDISLSGIGFEHPSPIGFAARDRLKVAFRLDDKAKSKITLQAEITRTGDYFIGARFIGGPVHHPSLGFYLQS